MDRVRAAFAATPRETFLPEDVRGRASYDGPLAIGHDQTNSQPRTVDDMLRLLDVRTGQSVLDVGSGSGWTTALLAHLVGPTGRVHGVEVVADLVTAGRANLAHLDRPWATIEQAVPDVLGLPDHAPYDRILVSAEARTMPDDLVDQLAGDGVMVVPVAGWMQRVVLPGPEVTGHGAYRFVPLV